LFKTVLSTNFDTITLESLEAPFQVESGVAAEMKKIDDKENLLQREWIQERTVLREKKQTVIQRLQEKMKGNFQLITNALLSYQVIYCF
jgi:hypothetical protein